MKKILALSIALFVLAICSMNKATAQTAVQPKDAQKVSRLGEPMKPETNMPSNSISNRATNVKNVSAHPATAPSTTVVHSTVVAAPPANNKVNRRNNSSIAPDEKQTITVPK